MKKLYSLLTIALFAVIVSCTDDDLDPLNFKKVTKGTLLALRGDALQSIYIDGSTYYSSFVPRTADGTETFTYDGEYLSDDPTSLESIDIFAEDSSGVRTLLKNVPASAFTTTGAERPMVSVSFTLAEILPKIGIEASFPLSPLVAGKLETTYKAGIAIVTDLNLKDGTKVLADDLVAIGLYQSDQFYPAQRLPFGTVPYCAYEEDSWDGIYKTLEIGEDETVGPYNTTFVHTGLDTYTISNVLNSEGDEDPDTEDFEIEVTFSPSTNPYDQDITVKTVKLGGGTVDFSGKGTYDECTHQISIDAVFGDYEFTFQLTKK